MSNSPTYSTLSDTEEADNILYTVTDYTIVDEILLFQLVGGWCVLSPCGLRYPGPPPFFLLLKGSGNML